MVRIPVSTLRANPDIIIEIWGGCGRAGGCITMLADSSVTEMKIMLVYITISHRARNYTTLGWLTVDALPELNYDKLRYFKRLKRDV